MTATKSVHGDFSLFINNSDTDYSPVKEVTMPPCTSHIALSKKVKEAKKVVDKYDVPYDEDFDTWFTKWEAQEAQRVIDGAPARCDEYGQEIDEGLEAYLARVQKDISDGLFKRNSKGVLVLTDHEEAGLVERKRGCLPPPLPKPDMTDEVLRDIKYMVQAEQQRFGTPMQGVAMTATVYQDLCSKIDREEKIRIEIKKITTEAMSAKNASSRVPWNGGDNTTTESPSDNRLAFSVGLPIDKLPGWPEPISPPPTSSAQDSHHSSLPVQPPTANSNGEEPSTPNTAYASGSATHFRSNPNTISPGNGRGSDDDDPIENSLVNQRPMISPDFHVQTGSGNRQGNWGHLGHRGGRKGRRNRGYGHQRNR